MLQTENKISQSTLKWLEEKATLLTSPELEELQNRIDALLEEKEKLLLAHKLSKEQLLNLYRGYGYCPKSGDKFWRIMAKGKGHGMYGLQVGEYTHSCHVDTLDVKVLVVIEPNAGGDSYVADYADLWLDGPIVV